MSIKDIIVADVDGVLHRGSLPAKWHHIIVKLLGMSNDADYQRYVSVRRAYRQGTASSEDHASAFLQSWIKTITNLPIDIAKQGTEELMSNEGFDNFIFPRNLLQLAYEKGYFLIGISRCPQFILEIYNSKFFKMDMMKGSSLIIDDGFLTGEVSNSRIFHDKKSILQEHLNDWDLTPSKRSICLGDTSQDIEWMELFKNPIAFNPDAPLIKHCTQNNWFEVHEHKDVVRSMAHPHIISPKELADFFFSQLCI